MRFSLIALSVLACSASWLGAQVARTSLNGTVTDEQGKRIPSAKVKAINAATGFQRETDTGTQGSYVLPDLETGTFTIEITKEGFEPFRRSGVRFELGQPRTLDVTLGIAGQKEQVSVTEAAFQLDRVDATVGAPVEAMQVDELPINGRNWSTLTSLVPGAVDTGAGDQRTIRFAGHGVL
ncbi:MAG TPA: carboxypeptidase-like regulatory domain-containing protein [Bryobacteraceae bacterium]|nr:carboxypeptidase-like regulatory domain-containing protein [Bryobacteraceae bacterium]